MSPWKPPPGILTADLDAINRVIVARNNTRRGHYTHRITIRPDQEAGDEKARALVLTRDELIALAELATEYVDEVL